MLVGGWVKVHLGKLGEHTFIRKIEASPFVYLQSEDLLHFASLNSACAY